MRSFKTKLSFTTFWNVEDASSGFSNEIPRLCLALILCFLGFFEGYLRKLDIVFEHF